MAFYFKCHFLFSSIDKISGEQYHFFKIKKYQILYMLIYKQFSFDSAHYLTQVPPTHKCSTMHGHTYTLTVWIKGELNREGWVMDFSDLKSEVKKVLAFVDHQCLNTVEGLENPTCEIFAMWLWDKLKVNIPLLYKIKLQETPTSGVVYKGN